MWYVRDACAPSQIMLPSRLAAASPDTWCMDGSARPACRSACRSRTIRLYASRSSWISSAAVGNAPGETQLTRISLGPSSRAGALVKAAATPMVETYAARSGQPPCMVIEATLTIAPPPSQSLLPSICLAACWAHSQ